MNAFVAFHVQGPDAKPLVNAMIAATGAPGPWQGRTNSCGDFLASLQPAHYELEVSAPGFVTRQLPADIGDSGQIVIGLEYGVTPALPLVFEGNHLANSAGEAVPLRTQSFFLGLQRLAHGDDIVQAIRYARNVAGSNCLRTFLFMYYVPISIGRSTLSPSEGLYYLDTFLSLAQQENMYVELTAGDAQMLLPVLKDQQEYFGQVAEVMKRHTNAILLELNEPWKNGFDPFLSLVKATGVNRARGSSPTETLPYNPMLDLIDQHTERSLDEGGYKWVRHQWEQWSLNRAYHEEPMGCGEMMIDGKRDNDPARFAQAAIVGEVSGLGWCFHPEYGIYATVPQPGTQQDACARAVGEARQWFKGEAQRWTPTRAGLANSALVLDDAHASRVYMRLGNEEGQAVAVNPRGYQAMGQNGWKVVKQSGAFIDMKRG